LGPATLSRRPKLSPADWGTSRALGEKLLRNLACCGGVGGPVEGGTGGIRGPQGGGDRAISGSKRGGISWVQKKNRRGKKTRSDHNLLLSGAIQRLNGDWAFFSGPSGAKGAAFPQGGGWRKTDPTGKAFAPAALTPRRDPRSRSPVK